MSRGSSSRPQPHSGFHRLTRASATQQYLLQMSLGPAADDDDRYAAKVLAIVLGDDSGSRLYWELVDPGIAEVAELSHGEYQGAGVFCTQISCAPEDAEEVYERMVEVYETAHAEGITEAELQQAKNKVRSQLVLSSERPSRRMFNVGGDWVYRREYRSLENDLERSRFAPAGADRRRAPALFAPGGDHTDDRTGVGPLWRESCLQG